jgi:hypothetical protein
MRYRTFRLAIVTALLGFPGLAAERPAPATSWGKPGISFEDYRRDSIACGKQGATTSMAERPEYDAVMLGIGRQDTDIDIGRSLPSSATHEDPTEKLARDYALNGAKSRPEPRVKALQGVLEAAVRDCLSDKGYVRFTLTPDQAAGLALHKKGSEGRFRYLHALASSDAVLSRQRTD